MNDRYSERAGWVRRGLTPGYSVLVVTSIASSPPTLCETPSGIIICLKVRDIVAEFASTTDDRIGLSDQLLGITRVLETP